MKWLTPMTIANSWSGMASRIEQMETEEALMTCESWQDISHYSLFVSGALPGIPIDIEPGY